jgi:hypothetical protein
MLLGTAHVEYYHRRHGSDEHDDGKPPKGVNNVSNAKLSPGYEQCYTINCFGPGTCSGGNSVMGLPRDIGRMVFWIGTKMALFA